MITKVMITTPHDTPDLSHHGKWARATLPWPRTPPHPRRAHSGQGNGPPGRPSANQNQNQSSKSRSRSKSKPSRGTGRHPASEEPHTSHRNRGTGTHQPSEEPNHRRPKPWHRQDAPAQVKANGHRASGPSAGTTGAPFPPRPTQGPATRGTADPHDRSNQAGEEQHQHTPETETEARRHPAWKSQWHSTEALGPGDQVAGHLAQQSRLRRRAPPRRRAGKRCLKRHRHQPKARRLELRSLQGLSAPFSCRVH
jgi:hypothetical protein